MLFLINSWLCGHNVLKKKLQNLQNKINQKNKTLTDTTNSLNNNPSLKRNN